MRSFEETMDEVEKLSIQAQEEADQLQISPYTRMKQLVNYGHAYGANACKKCIYRISLPKGKKMLPTCAVIGESTDKSAHVDDNGICNFYSIKK